MKKNRLRKLVLLSVLFIITSLLLVNVVYGWLARTGLAESTFQRSGFSIVQSAFILHDNYKLETRYTDASGQLVKITLTDDEAATPDILQLLTPGARTEFRTDITNLSTETMNTSLYLYDVGISAAMADYIRIGAYSPDAYSYGKDDFILNTAGDYYENISLLLAQNVSILPNQTVCVYWYIYTSNEVDFGSFSALKTNGSFETLQDDENNDYYYCVTDIDANNDNEIVHAYLCDACGNLVDEDFIKIGTTGVLKEFDFADDRSIYSFGNVDYVITTGDAGGLNQNNDVYIKGLHLIK